VCVFNYLICHLFLSYKSVISDNRRYHQSHLQFLFNCIASSFPYHKLAATYSSSNFRLLAYLGILWVAKQSQTVKQIKVEFCNFVLQLIWNICWLKLDVIFRKALLSPMFVRVKFLHNTTHVRYLLKDYFIKNLIN
jgi:hypothetical protein